jgi:hypothetical protein
MFISALRRAVKAFRGDRRGNVAILAAMAMPVIAGSLGIGAEVASWYSDKRALQNAADSAAIAAATNADATYANEARAVAGRYGYHNGVDGVTIAASNTAACPGGGNNCFSVTISRLRPLMLAQVVGLEGDAQVNGSPAKLISAKAVAIQANAPREYCLLALASSGYDQGIYGDGSPTADLTGCRIMSNTASRCNGHTLNADMSDAYDVSDGCGKKNNSNIPKASDPYVGLRSNIPADSCGGSYAQAPKKKNDPPLPSSNTLHGLDGRSFIEICGDAELNGPTFLSNSSGDGTVLIVRNGSLNLKGYTLQTMNHVSVTIIFAGNDTSRMHAPIGNGGFDIKAPSTGPWKGVAIYQDPTMTDGVDISEAGNTPTWKISGLVYLPHASVKFNGVVNKASYGDSCFAMVVDHILVNGTAQILAQGECARAGLQMPMSIMPSRGELVS